MSYTLTDDEFRQITEYFELALTVISDEEQVELVLREKPLRDMLRDIKRRQTAPQPLAETTSAASGTTAQP